MPFVKGHLKLTLTLAVAGDLPMHIVPNGRVADRYPFAMGKECRASLVRGGACLKVRG